MVSRAASRSAGVSSARNRSSPEVTLWLSAISRTKDASREFDRAGGAVGLALVEAKRIEAAVGARGRGEYGTFDVEGCSSPRVSFLVLV